MGLLWLPVACGLLMSYPLPFGTFRVNRYNVRRDLTRVGARWRSLRAQWSQNLEGQFAPFCKPGITSLYCVTLTLVACTVQKGHVDLAERADQGGTAGF